MKTIRFICTLTRGLLVAFVVVSGAASAYTLSISPSAQNVGLGSFATVEVRITDVAPEPPGSPGGLGNYDFEVVYDPAIIKFDKATDAGALGLAIGLDVDFLAPGRLNLSAFSLEDPTDLLALQSDSMLLLTLGFKSLAVGTSGLAFENVTLGDVNGVEREHSTTNGSITVLFAQLPEPGTLALLAGAGLILLPVRMARRARGGSPTHQKRPRHRNPAITRHRLERRGAKASRWR